MPLPTQATDLAAQFEQLRQAFGQMQSNYQSLQRDHDLLKDDLCQRSTITPNYSKEEYPDTSPIRLRAKDLPKYDGGEGNNIDEWIEKVTAIYEFSGVSDAEFLKNLPMILEAKALTWFTQLGKDKRATLITWDDWQSALKNAFFMPNHQAHLRRECLYRTLQDDESMADYFQDKQRLQHYVFPKHTSDYELISDMLDGIPVTITPLIKASITRQTTLEEFRRILIDLEPGLCGQYSEEAWDMDTAPLPPDSFDHDQLEDDQFPRYDQLEDYQFSPPDQIEDAQSPHGPPFHQSKQPVHHQQTEQRLPKSQSSHQNPPPSPCYSCGGNHWNSDCPSRAQHISHHNKAVNQDGLQDEHQPANVLYHHRYS